MKKNKIFWGVILIAAAVLLLLDALEVTLPLANALGDVSIFSIVFGVLILCFIGSKLIRGEFHEIFLPLALLFAIFEKNIAYLLHREDPNLIQNGILFLVAVLLTIGVSRLTTGRKGIFRTNVKRGGRSTVYVDCANFVTEEIENNMGSCNVHFTNAEAYTGGGVLEVENNMGSMVIHVPSTWHVVSAIENNMGSASIPAHEASGDGPTLTITGENNMGSLRVEYV